MGFAGWFADRARFGEWAIRIRDSAAVLGWPGGDRLSQALRLSTIGAEGFDGRVRNGIGFAPLARATRPAKHRAGRSPAPAAGNRQWVGVQSDCRLPIACCRSALVFPFCAASCRQRSLINESEKFGRAISTGQLHALPHFHTRPIDVVVFHGSSGRTRFEVGFPLRCFQRLSRPHIATLRCGWRHNRSTRGASIPVLSY